MLLFVIAACVRSNKCYFNPWPIHVPMFTLHDLCKVCDVSAVDCSVGLGMRWVRPSDCTSEHRRMQYSVIFVFLSCAIIPVFIFRPHRSTIYVDAAYSYRPSSVVCRSVTLVSPAKTAALIELPFGLRTWVGLGSHVLDGGPYPPKGRGKFWGRMGVPL